MSGVVAGVWRYPVKGVGGEELGFAEVAPGKGVAFDRRWMLAVTDDISSLFAAGGERWTPWEYGVTLKKHSAAANLRAEVEESGANNARLNWSKLQHFLARAGSQPRRVEIQRQHKTAPG